jgi:DNA invertase Pin-like site-specific DNA recombinase
MKKVAMYARVSTTDKGQDVDLQLRDLRNYVGARGWTTFKEYVDNGVSGSKDKRPKLDAMMNDAKKRKFDVVLVWRFDRFARSTKHLIDALEDFKCLGIDFVSYMENIDTTTPGGKLIFTVFSAFAEFELNILKERVRAGLANAKAKGKTLGRPSAKVDREELVQLRGQGLSIREIGVRLQLDKMVVQKNLREIFPVCKTLKNPAQISL